MTNGTRNGLIALAVIGIGGVLAWKFLLQTKRAFVRIITKKGAYKGSAITLMTFDEGFLKEWAKAVRKDKPKFSYNGKEYNTQGGKAA